MLPATTMFFQIPKDMNEELLLPFFSEFGPVAELTVIRDKVSQTHKGGHNYSQIFDKLMRIVLINFSISYPSRLCIFNILHATVGTEGG